MLSLDVKGQILNVINKLYSNAKCYVKMNGKLSNVFKSEIGVRQGDNLSLLLFLFYLSDLESFRSSKYSGLAYISELTENDDDLYINSNVQYLICGRHSFSCRVINRASNVVRMMPCNRSVSYGS